MPRTASELEDYRRKKNDDLAKIQMAAEARQLLENPLLINAFKAIEGHEMGKILNSRDDDIKGRERAYRQLRAAQLFRAALHTFVDSGKIAETERVLDERDQVTPED